MAYTNFTNCTKEQYESIIYSEEDTNRIRIWFNNVELLDADEYCESFSGANRILPDDGNKIFTLDNFVAKNYTLILRDLPEGTIIADQVRISIGTLVNENNNTYEDVPIGIFNIQDTPINDKGRVTIKLRDNRVKFDFNYNAQPLIESLGGTATKKQILEDICNQAGVTNNVSTFDGEDDEIGIYDNTITATTYVSYIFEQAGLMPFINREGQLDKINLNDLKVWRIPLSIVEKYEKGTPFKIERVVYESGIIKYESSNDETLDTLYLNSANPYINNKQQIDNIYNLLVGFSVDSVKSGKILGNPAIDPFDIILIYDDEINDNPISTATGTNLTLENTPNASTNIDLLGNTTQNTTTGKNLLKNTSTNSGDNNYWYQYSTFDEATGTLTRSVTATSESYITHRINLKNNTKYTISCLAKSNGYVSSFEMFAFDLNFAKIYHMAGTSLTTNFVKYSFTFTTDASTNFTNASIRFDNNGSTQSGTEAILTIKDVMLVEGEDTEYEPYTYGASPNPNFPQPIETTTGRNVIEVAGKNIYDNNYRTTSNSIYCVNGTATESGGVFTLNATGTDLYMWQIASAGTSYNKEVCGKLYDFIENEYTISITNHTMVANYITFFDENKVSLGFIGFGGVGYTRTIKKGVNNVPSNAKYFSLRFGYNQAVVNENYSFSVQLEKGSTATTYKPYIGNSYEVNLGKNLFDKDSADIGVAYIDSSTGAIINGGGSTTIKYYEVEPNTQYTLTAKQLQRLAFYNSSKTKLLVSSTTNTTFTTPANTKYVSIQLATSTYNVNEIQLEKGDVASSYSPYFEPIELCKIGTYQDRLFKASGKNLFDKDTQDYKKGYYLNASGVETSGANWGVYYIPVIPNTSYTISGCQTNGGVQFCWFTNNKAFISAIGQKQNRTMTSPSNAGYIGLSIVWNTSSSAYDNNIMLEKSSSATTYEPYGNYWYKYNAIGKVVLNGSESWVSQSYGTNSWALNNVIAVNYDANKIQVMSRKFKGVEQANRNTNNSVIYTTSNSQVYIRNTPYTTLAQAQSGMSGEPLYYVLATPTYERITNDELIGQLNRLKTIQTIEGTTNIQQNNSSSPFELNVEYFNESYILKTLANNTYKYIGINRNEFNTEISLEQRKENVSIKSEATYQKIAKTEIDAANASISMITGELGFVDGESQVINGVISRQTTTENTIKVITSFDENGNPIGVKTTKGFTFDKNGLNITSSDNTYKTKIDEQGTYYYDGEEILGQTTKEGSKFKNMDLYGEFHYGMDEITDTPLFVSMKFTDGSEECFGHFWNGS